MSKLSDVTSALRFRRPYADFGGEGTTTAPAYFMLAGTDGTPRYYFNDASGNLRVHTSVPTAATDGNVAVTGGQDGVMLVADKTITSAQALALNATPISVIAAPGASKAIVPLMTVFYTAGGTAYAGIAAGEDLVLRYTDGSGTIAQAVETTGWLDQTTAQTRVVGGFQSAADTAKAALTPTANAALVAHLLVGEITTGNYDIKMRVYYRIVPTVL